MNKILLLKKKIYQSVNNDSVWWRDYRWSNFFYIVFVFSIIFIIGIYYFYKQKNVNIILGKK